MNGSPAVIVNKGGFLSALVKGLFGTIMVIVVCGTAIGLYGMRMVDNKIELVAEDFTSISEQILAILPEWQKAMPPAIRDSLNDRRAPDYREQVELTARLARYDGRRVVVVEVTNKGDEIISMMPLRVVLEDESGIPVHELTMYAVSPLQLCDEFPGPLMPHSGPRKMAQRVWHELPDGVTVTVEMTDLRVACEPASPAEHDVPGVAGENASDAVTMAQMDED